MRLPWSRHDDRGAISDRGRVACPYLGDVDIERCYVCPRLEQMDDLGTNVRIECRLPRLEDDPAVRFPFIGA